MIICKICNKEIEGNGYCGKHSTGGTGYLEEKCKEFNLSKEEISAVLSSLEYEIEMYKFIRGFGEKTANEIVIQKLIDKLK